VDNLPPTSETISPAIEQAVMTGDLAELTTAQRAEYYSAVCKSLGLNPLTQPFSLCSAIISSS
jgi:hypothetical protein